MSVFLCMFPFDFSVDLKKYPEWGEVEYYHADLEAGDCMFIPDLW